MALQTSGAISLNDMHVEAGGGSGTQASINDSDIRGLIGKGSGAQASFSEWYGASSGPPYFKQYTLTAAAGPIGKYGAPVGFQAAPGVDPYGSLSPNRDFTPSGYVINFMGWDPVFEGTVVSIGGGPSYLPANSFTGFTVDYPSLDLQGSAASYLQGSTTAPPVSIWIWPFSDPNNPQTSPFVDGQSYSIGFY